MGLFDSLGQFDHFHCFDNVFLFWQFRPFWQFYRFGQVCPSLLLFWTVLNPFSNFYVLGVCPFEQLTKIKLQICSQRMTAVTFAKRRLIFDRWQLLSFTNYSCQTGLKLVIVSVFSLYIAYFLSTYKLNEKQFIQIDYKKTKHLRVNLLFILVFLKQNGGSCLQKSSRIQSSMEFLLLR